MKNKSIFLVLVFSLISLSACTTDEKKLSGTLVGAAGGAAIGSMFGGGSGHIVGAVIGAGAGGFLGHEVGKKL
jgi:uncharacterized protein YcfJ